MNKQPAVYFLTNKRNGTLYVGVTSNLPARMWQHKTDQLDGFTKKYQIHKLVYFELHNEMTSAIEREKQIKKWRRRWKLDLIINSNPEWNDLYDEITA